MPRKPPPPDQQDLLDRLREHLSDEPVTREKSMFGGICMMVSDKILVSAGRDGSLLVRVDADHHDELLTRPGARQAEMGEGRDMGPGWITVSARAIDSDADLRAWLEATLRYNRRVTGGAR